jgi:hypothetical protein
VVAARGSVAVYVRGQYVVGNWNFRAPQLCDSADACETNNDSNCINETGAAHFGD